MLPQFSCWNLGLTHFKNAKRNWTASTLLFGNKHPMGCSKFHFRPSIRNKIFCKPYIWPKPWRAMKILVPLKYVFFICWNMYHVVKVVETFQTSDIHCCHHFLWSDAAWFCGGRHVACCCWRGIQPGGHFWGDFSFIVISIVIGIVIVIVIFIVIMACHC